MEVLSTIPIDLNPKAIQETLQVERTGAWEQFQSAFEIACGCIAGRAVYAIRYVEARSDDGVVIDGVYFKSRVLRKNLEHVGRVFPYVVTIGPALEERAQDVMDLLEKYYLDAIGNAALINARKYLEQTLRSRFALDGLSFMSPGSLEDWSLDQQKPLFSFLDSVEHLIGVRLTEDCRSEDCVMVPRKSVSGIYFPTKTTFYNCQLCPRDRCPGRKAPYSLKLAKKYGITKK